MLQSMNKAHLERSARALQSEHNVSTVGIVNALRAHQEILENLCEHETTPARRRREAAAKAKKAAKSEASVEGEAPDTAPAKRTRKAAK